MLSVLLFRFSTSHLAGLGWAERGERLERRLANRKERCQSGMLLDGLAQLPVDLNPSTAG